jgi:hypothetical protein
MTGLQRAVAVIVGALSLVPVAVIAIMELDHALCIDRSVGATLGLGSDVGGTVWRYAPKLLVHVALALFFALPGIVAGTMSRSRWVAALLIILYALPALSALAFLAPDTKWHDCDRKGCTMCEIIAVGWLFAIAVSWLVLSVAWAVNVARRHAFGTRRRKEAGQ